MPHLVHEVLCLKHLLRLLVTPRGERRLGPLVLPGAAKQRRQPVIFVIAIVVVAMVVVVESGCWRHDAVLRRHDLGRSSGL